MQFLAKNITDETLRPRRMVAYANVTTGIRYAKTQNEVCGITHEAILPGDYGCVYTEGFVEVEVEK